MPTEDRRHGPRAAGVQPAAETGLDWIHREQQPPTRPAEVIPLPGAARPEILVLCGSLRYESHNTHTALRETLSGRAVLSVIDLDIELPSEVQAQLDQADHGRIDQADRVLVINVDGYISAGTRRAISYALEKGKPVGYLQPPETEPTL
jgi:hypothetical protein